MKKSKTLTAFVLACFAVIAAVAVIAGKSKKADAAEATQYIYRISGESRYETAIKVADELKNYTGVSRFDSVVIASGLSFPDALAGSYLAIKKDAPILLIANNQKYIDMVSSYVKENLKSNGTVYILGGEGAVSAECEEAFSDFNVERLSGTGRIETNLAILEEAGVTDEDILVCTAGGFPDSLSASATGRPILLVGRSLTEEQKEWLASLEGNGNKFYIIGGTGVVGAAVENEIKAYADEAPTRLAGSDRFNTSILIAEEFFPSAHGMTLAYSHNFPDGLSGGPLAAACG
ncbi:MAG: cell wall-binding repeat-containing protein, partial [Lachnospiraceae bacterium]|nr:cell wall-binding repeat-containing protein [Lachnospiraceae bacterium]